MRSRTALVALALLCAPTLLTSCSDDADPPASGGTPTAPASSTPSTVPTTTPSPAGRLSFVPPGGTVDCLEDVRDATDVGLWGGKLTASAPLKIVDIVATSKGVRFAGGLAVPLLDPDFHTSIASDWPPEAPDRATAKGIDWKARTGLAGLHLDAGENVLPVWHLVGKPGAHVADLRVSYVLDGVDDRRTVVVPLNLSFAPGSCPGFTPY